MAKTTDAPDPNAYSTYVIERKLTLDDLGVGPGQANGADTLGTIRTAFTQLGPAWVFVGEANANRPEKAMELAMGDPETVVSGEYRATAKRYVGKVVPVQAQTQTILVFGTPPAPPPPAPAQRAKPPTAGKEVK